jgi:nitrogen fixation protein FixH
MLVVVAVNAVLAVFAFGTFSGLETEDHYRKGLAYNRALAAAEAQEQRGWEMDLSFLPEARDSDQRRGDLVVTFTDRDGQPLRHLNVEATLFRPTHQGFDQSVNLDHRGEGNYGAAIAVPLAGQWEARVHAHQDGTNFQMSRRINVP